MSKYILTKRQFQLLMETGAANAAMDLDRYVQQVDVDTSNGNGDVIDTIDDMVNKLNELKNMFKGGKKIHSSVKNQIFSLDDRLKQSYLTISSAV